MRRIALVSAALMLAVGSVGTASATAALPFAAAPVSISGVSANRLALGLAQPAQDEATTSSDEGGSSTGILVAGAAVIAIGLGVYAATSNNDTTPASS